MSTEIVGAVPSADNLQLLRQGQCSATVCWLCLETALSTPLLPLGLDVADDVSHVLRSVCYGTLGTRLEFQHYGVLEVQELQVEWVTRGYCRIIQGDGREQLVPALFVLQQCFRSFSHCFELFVQPSVGIRQQTSLSRHQASECFG